MTSKRKPRKGRSPGGGELTVWDKECGCVQFHCSCGCSPFRILAAVNLPVEKVLCEKHRSGLERHIGGVPDGG
jgi:hypothetical protein